jgi:hypothetical protein
VITRNKLAASAMFALCLVIAQFGVVRVAPTEWPVRVVVPATIAAAPLALWVHRGRAGVWVIFVGLAANLCVILANGGLMPMERSTLVEAVGYERADAYETGGWIAGSKDVLVERGQGGRLVALGDGSILRIGGGGLVASPGDVVIWSGLVILAAEASITWQMAGRRARIERARQIAHARDALAGAREQMTAEGDAATQT